MDRYDRMENNSNLNSYVGYSLTEPGKLHLRRITDEEYNALPDKCKSRLKLLLNARGFAFIFSLIFTSALVINSVSEMINKAPDSGMHFFISAMLALFMDSITGLVVSAELNRLVPRNALVTAGEVAKVTILRGPNNAVGGADHIIALHGSRRIVTIRDRNPIASGNTVLIIKSRRLEYFLQEVPSWAVSYDRDETDYSEEIASAGDLPIDDYSKYDKVSVFEAQKRAVSGEEYRQIPVKYRSPRPLSYGLLSWAWSITTLVVGWIILAMVYARKNGNSERFFVLFGILFCIMILEIFLTGEAFKVQLPKKTTCCIEGIPVRKLKVTGSCFISVILPDKRQYIDRIMVEPEAFGMIKENEHYKMYFNIQLPRVKHVHGIYDKY